MRTGTDLRNYATAKVGYRYDTGPTRTTGADGYFDCSGLVTYAALRCQVWQFPTVSALQARYCRDAQTLTTVDLALASPGCLLFEGPNMGYDGFGPSGHVAITVGDGQSVVEAKGHAYGVLTDSALNRGWTNAARVPGISYVPNPPPEEPVLKLDPDDIDAIIQRLWVYDPAKDIAGGALPVALKRYLTDPATIGPLADLIVAKLTHS